MSRLVNVEINGLFGNVNHPISFRTEAPTIITAPNGAGKTHVLGIIRACLSLDFRALMLFPFSSLLMDFSDGSSLSAERRNDENRGTVVSVQARRFGASPSKILLVDADSVERLQPEVPPFLQAMEGGRWLDRRTGRIVSRDFVERRYRIKPEGTLELIKEEYPEIFAICAGRSPLLIDTKRLDRSMIERSISSEFSGEFRPSESASAARIHEYMALIRAEVTEARRSSVQATQSADLSFAARALAAARKTVKEPDLHERYNRTVERYENLARNALAVGDAPIEFPSKTTPTVRRILNVFLDDWDKRLEPLLPLNSKIQTLREIIDSKLKPSGKTTRMSPRGDLEFRSLGGRRIPVLRLSSGEQHLVALYTQLLFSARSGSLVLIDEPEISLHAAWKHAFLEDISRVAAIGDFQVVLATHSSGIINGRWDLTEELEFSHEAEADLTEFEEFDDLDEVDA